MARAFLVLLAALVLTACNAVVSEKPLFSRGGPQLKPGLWAMIEDAGCAFDPANPPARWPDCAGKAVFDGRDMRNPDGDEAFGYVFAGGQPRILQLRMSDEEDKARALYFFLALEPAPGGREVTEATAWLVQCGPPPASTDPASRAPPGLTDAPLPGLEIRDKTCFADRASEVRNAARPSRAWGEPMRFVWVGPVPRP